MNIQNDLVSVHWVQIEDKLHNQDSSSWFGTTRGRQLSAQQRQIIYKMPVRVRLSPAGTLTEEDAERTAALRFRIRQQQQQHHQDGVLTRD